MPKGRLRRTQPPVIQTTGTTRSCMHVSPALSTVQVFRDSAVTRIGYELLSSVIQHGLLARRSVASHDAASPRSWPLVPAARHRSPQPAGALLPIARLARRAAAHCDPQHGVTPPRHHTAASDLAVGTAP